MSELGKQRKISQTLRHVFKNSDYCCSVFFHLLRRNLGLSILGPAVLIYCSIPFLLIVAVTYLYFEEIETYQKPEIVVFLGEEVSAEKAISLTKMISSVTKTDTINIIDPKTAAKMVTNSLELSAEIGQKIKFPRSIHIEFPADSEPVVLNELSQLLLEDSRISYLESNIESYKLFTRVDTYWYLVLSTGFGFTASLCFLFGYVSISIFSRAHLAEMSSMFLLGTPSKESARPLIILGIILGSSYLAGCMAIYPILAKGVITSVDWLFNLQELNKARISSVKPGLLISLGGIVVSYSIGVAISIKKTRFFTRKLASED